MRWPWSNQRNGRRLCVRVNADLLAFVLTDGARQVLQWGALKSDDAAPHPWQRLQAELQARPGELIALLEPQDYQIFKVDTPPVPPAELKAAARWLVKELVDAPLDELTLDVMHVGHDPERTPAQVFVVTARNSLLQALSGQLAPLRLDIADIWETALRNLLALEAQREGLQSRACAALLWRDSDAALLCVCVEGELFYSRRIDSDPRLLERALRRDAKPEAGTPGLLLDFAEPDVNGMVDYSASDEDSPLIIELQRSIDVWERSAPDLPLARLIVVAAEHGTALAALLQRELGLRSSALDLSQHFQGLSAAGRGAELAECLPLLGAALRDSGKEL